MNRPTRLHARKLLVASLGVAAVNYAVACQDPLPPPTSGNLMSVPAAEVDAGAPPSPAAVDASADAGGELTTTDASPAFDPDLMGAPTSGNLMAYAPDAGKPRAHPVTPRKPMKPPTSGNLMRQAPDTGPDRSDR